MSLICRAMLAVCAILLLCMTSLNRSAPMDCEHLLRPLGQMDPRGLEERWAMVAGSMNQLSLVEHLRSIDSATASFSNNTDYSSIIFSRTIRTGIKCNYASYNISLEGRRFTFHDSIATTFIHTSCRDCILLSFDVESGKRLHFYLFSRRRQLEQAEVEEFRAQVECLKMPPPVVMDPAKELCPEETDNPATQAEEKKERKPGKH